MAVAWALGDCATGNAHSAQLAQLVAGDKPDAFLMLGDVYEGGSATEFAVNYEVAWGKLNPVCYPIPGNHDWGNYSTGYQPYFEKAGRPTTPNYRFELGGWAFWMLNSEDVPSAETYVSQSRTLLQNHKNIACWHRPRYCSGSHGDATDTDVLWQLLAPHCPIILGGHAHNAQHFKPDSTGCRQLVSGAGGRSLYAEIPGDTRLEWGESSGYAAVRLELDTKIGVRWVSEQGTVLYETTA